MLSVQLHGGDIWSSQRGVTVPDEAVQYPHSCLSHSKCELKCNWINGFSEAFIVGVYERILSQIHTQNCKAIGFGSHSLVFIWNL